MHPKLAPTRFTWEVMVPCACICTWLESTALSSEHFQTLFTQTAVKSWGRCTDREARYLCFKMSIYFCHIMYLDYSFLIIFLSSDHYFYPLILLESHDILPVSVSKSHLPNMHVHACMPTHTDTRTHHTHSHMTDTRYQVQHTFLHNHTHTPGTHHTHTFTQTYVHATCNHTSSHRHTPPTHHMHTQNAHLRTHTHSTHSTSKY